MSKQTFRTASPLRPRIYLVVTRDDGSATRVEAHSKDVPSEALELAEKLLSALAHLPGSVSPETPTNLYDACAKAFDTTREDAKRRLSEAMPSKPLAEDAQMPMLAHPLSAEVTLGATWDALGRPSQQVPGSFEEHASMLTVERAEVGGTVVEPAPKEEGNHPSPLHWAHITYDLTCALSHLVHTAWLCSHCVVGPVAARPMLDLAAAAVAFTVQLAIEIEDPRDPTELRALERRLIGGVGAAIVAQELRGK